MNLAKGTSRGFSTIIDQPFNEVEVSYNRVAEQYAVRIFGELEHKPLDRELLDDSLRKFRHLDPSATWAVDQGTSPVISTIVKCRS